MALNIPNDIEVDTNADAVELQQNFDAIQNHVNIELINRQGTVAMTSPLLLPGDPAGDNQASNKRYVDNKFRNGGTMTGDLVVGTSPAAGTAGVQLFNEGAITVRRARSDGNIVVLSRGTGQGGAVGESYLRFMNKSEPADVQAGNITLQLGPTVNYGTSSDYRLKNDQGSITDAAQRLKQLRPIRFLWLADPEAGTMDGFLAHEVQAVVPEAVVGAKDAITESGEIDPQQLDTAKLVPLLTAALIEALARIEALENR